MSDLLWIRPLSEPWCQGETPHQGRTWVSPLSVSARKRLEWSARAASHEFRCFCKFRPNRLLHPPNQCIHRTFRLHDRCYEPPSDTQPYSLATVHKEHSHAARSVEERHLSKARLQHQQLKTCSKYVLYGTKGTVSPNPSTPNEAQPPCILRCAVASPYPTTDRRCKIINLPLSHCGTSPTHILIQS